MVHFTCSLVTIFTRFQFHPQPCRSLINLIADEDWPRPIADVWLGLESELTSVFRLQDQVFFLKRNKAWVLWSTSTKSILDQFPISQALPFLVGLGQVGTLSTMHFQHDARLLVFHKIKGQSLMSTIDASTSQVISTQKQHEKWLP